MKFYKYCAFDKYTIENILKSQVYFNTVCNFNDPLEFKPVSLENIKKENRLFINTSGDTPSSKEVELNYKNFLNKITNLYGIFCLSQKKDNLLMWSHYANNHKGICLEFEINLPDKNFTKKFFEQTIEDFLDINHLKNMFTTYFIAPVLYQHNRVIPEIIVEPEKRIGINITYALITKFKYWEYEWEFRIILELKNKIKRIFPCPINYHPQCLTGIILGERTNAEDEETLKLLIKKLEHKPTLYKAMLDDNEYKLNILPLEN